MPLSEKSRTFIICFDGTGQHGVTETNVNRLQRLIDNKIDDSSPSEIRIEYSPGPGSRVSSIANVPLNVFSRAFDLAFAWSIRRRIMYHYKWLMEHYKPGDRICLFGFSRGAYIARCLAAMLSSVGLLMQQNNYQVKTAWDLYLRSHEHDGVEAKRFRATFSREVEIDFLGIWDTVASAIRSHPMEAKNMSVRRTRHAVALDERRSLFCVTPLSPDGNSNDENLQQEVWFAGCHSDVGGGQHAGRGPHNLGNPPLLWMMQQIEKAEIQGVRWRTSSLQDEHLAPPLIRAYCIPQAATAAPNRHQPVTVGSNQTNQTRLSEGVHDLLKQDAVTQIRDPLSRFSPWWLLEFIPVLHVNPSTGKRYLRIPRGRCREIRGTPLLHGSVELRCAVNQAYNDSITKRVPGGVRYIYD